MIGELATHGGPGSHEERVGAAAVVDRAFAEGAALLRRLAAELEERHGVLVAGEPQTLLASGDVILASSWLRKFAEDLAEKRVALRASVTTWGET